MCVFLLKSTFFDNEEIDNVCNRIKSLPAVLLAREIKGGALQYISYNINNL